MKNRDNCFLQILILIVASPYFVLSQTSFQKVYGGTEDDDVKRICTLSDGNFLITGSTLSYGAGATDAYLLKIDEAGSIIWANTYGHNDDDYFEWAEETDDSGFIICGYTFSVVKQNFKIIILKTDSNGIMEWQQQIGMSSVARSYCIRQTFDRGYILSGEEDSSAVDGSILLIKLDSLGNLQWNKSFGIPTNADVGHCVIQTHDSGFAVCGQSRAGLYSSFAVVIKTDETGNLMWSKNYYQSNPASDRSYAYRIHELQNGNLVVSGSSYLIGQFVSSTLVFEMDLSGALVWSNLYSTGAGDAAHDLIEMEDGSGYLISGYSLSPQTGTSNGLVLKVDRNGNQLWNEYYGNDSLDSYFYSCAVKEGSILMLAGNTYSYGAGGQDIFIARRDSSPVSNDCNTNTRTFSTIVYLLTDFGPVNFYPLSLALSTLNFTASSGVSSSTVCLGTGISEIGKESEFTIYPNPGKNFLYLDNPAKKNLTELNLYDQLGRLVWNLKLNSDERTIRIKIPELNDGIYSLELIADYGRVLKLFCVE